MAYHFQNEIDYLKKSLLTLSTMVEEQVYSATKAFVAQDVESAKKIIDTDLQIDSMEIEVEEECLKILALHQPVATDLRFVIAVLKMNNDLERIGDLAAGIASRALAMGNYERIDIPETINNMTEKVKTMLRKSLDALVRLDCACAREVCLDDEEVDTMNRDMHILVKDMMKKSPDNAPAYIELLSVSKNLERIADLATNIAEDVIYLIEGDIVRHGRDQLEH